MYDEEFCSFYNAMLDTASTNTIVQINMQSLIWKTKNVSENIATRGIENHVSMN